MRFGIDRLIDEDFAALSGRRVGLFSNMSAVNRDLRTTYDVLRNATNVQLAALFGPEHGFSAMAQDGISVDSSTDPLTGLPVYSLYGASERPTQEMLAGIDLMICDIQDIGVRYYTFLWTVTHILEACGEYGVPVLILDRPNPLGGAIDGGTLQPELSSLVGRFPIPIQHGLSLGELAKMLNALHNQNPAEVSVIACDGWQRQQTWDQIGRAFVAPSPNMPHFVTAQHYPGACLIEGTTLSEGRGTPLPFEVVGAPYIDGFELAEVLNAQMLPGVRFRPHQFQPNASKYNGQSCGGVQAHITGPDYRPLPAWLTVIQIIRSLYADDFAWLPPHAPGAMQHFDRLIGSADVRQQIEQGASFAEISAGWPAFHAEFEAATAPYRIYYA